MKRLHRSPKIRRHTLRASPVLFKARFKTAGDEMPATSDRELIETWQDEPAPLLPLLHAFHDR
ncbi:MAG: hypothetical protein VX254_10195, partial [Planctomycetota bacterium]|nr:hypothetical protein [Planctomycetota bacterium]